MTASNQLPADPNRTDDPTADRLPYRIVRPYRVRFEEATLAETVRPAVVLAWVADVAWQHSTLLGFDRQWYSSQGLFWLVRAISLDVLAPIATYQAVTVSTQVIGYRRVAARRESEVRDERGDLLARAEIDWVMVNERGMPARVPDSFLQFAVDGGVPYEMHKVPLPDAPGEALERRFHVRRRDLDPMDHVNNSVYLDYFEQGLADSGQERALQRLPRRYVLEFLNSAARGEAVTGKTWRTGERWCYRMAREDGTELLRATMEPPRTV